MTAQHEPSSPPLILVEMSTQSTRLPQKWKRPINGFPLWLWVVEGARKVAHQLGGTLLLKLPHSPLEEPLREALLGWIQRDECILHHGKKEEGDDYSFLRAFPREWVLRLTGDNPFIPPFLASRLWESRLWGETHLPGEPPPPLLCTRSDRLSIPQYPPGLDIELIRWEALRETGWSLSRLYSMSPPTPLPPIASLDGLACTVDTEGECLWVDFLARYCNWKPTMLPALRDLIRVWRALKGES